MDFAAGLRMSESTAVVAMSGLLNKAAEPGLTETWDRVAAETSGPVLLDFTEVEYINSTGIALIVGVLGKARAAGRDLRAFGLSDHYREIFQITRLSDFMSMYDDETAAAVG
jgi:anti-anti-sigma factor